MYFLWEVLLLYMTEIELLLIVLCCTIRTCRQKELYDEKPIALTAKKTFLLHMRPILDSPMEEPSSKENARGAILS